MFITKTLSILFIPFLLFSKEMVPVFTPPSDFYIQDPKNYPPFIKIAFCGKERDSFRPSINLAVEKNAGSEREFLSCVTNLQKKRVGSQWKKLSILETKAGTAHLFQDEVITKAGKVVILQSILVKNEIAYILTANYLKSKKQVFHSRYLKTFQTFTLTDDLFSLIEDENKRSFLIKEKQKLTKKNFQTFKKIIENNFSEMGLYWKVLSLEKAYRELLKPAIVNKKN